MEKIYDSVRDKAISKLKKKLGREYLTVYELRLIDLILKAIGEEMIKHRVLWFKHDEDIKNRTLELINEEKLNIDKGLLDDLL